MRPAAKMLDQMMPEQVIADNSPLWPFLCKVFELGYHKALLPEAVGGGGPRSRSRWCWRRWGGEVLGGGAGISAALAPVEGGAKVIVFERRPPVVRTNYIEGICAMESL
ncbi:MAG: hypothetical protein A4E65_03060 [Syntrophorhabdus sp. PtaU1.Bin153]|nr:MAG: hypothetical protein A4E65_03060 [Syntrophorhabdus sp. PtaU1.Bin153]